MNRAFAVAVLLAGTVAHAEGPAVDVNDLPPLPAAEDEPSSSATVLAAASAEEDVVIGAAKREQSLGNVASAVTVVSGDRIRRFGYRTVGEAMAAVAGVYLVDNRLSYSVGIRGLQIPGDFNTRVLVLVDGATVNESWGSYAGLGFDAVVGIEDIARIEVIRGPVSSVYGTNAFFGIINIVTRGAAETPRAWARTGVNSINGIVSSVGFASGGVDQQVRGSFHFMNRFGEGAGAIALPDGGDINSNGDNSRSYVGGIVAAYGGSFVQARALHYNRQSPFAPYDVLAAGPAYNQFDTLFMVEGGHARQLSDRFAITARAYANLYKFDDDSPPADPVTASALDTTGTAQTYGAELRGRYELIVPDKLGITAGTEVSYNRTHSTAFTIDKPNDLIADVPINFTLAAAYSEIDAAPTSWLGLTAGLRFDRNSAFENRLSPRAALFVSKPDRYGAKLLYAEGFRNPSAFEAYFQDGSDFIAHPEELAAEKIRSIEGVLWAKPVPGLATRISAYYWDARDIIEAQPAPEDMTKLQFQNVTRYVSAGVEVEASYRNSEGWYAFGGAAYTNVGTEDEMGTVSYGDVTNAPVISGGAGVSTPRLFGWAHLSTEAIFLGERPTRPAPDPVNPDATVPSPAAPAWLGLNINVYAPNVRGFDITAGVRNLIGKRDLIPAPGDYDRTTLETRTVPRVPGEGREVYVKIGYSY